MMPASDTEIRDSSHPITGFKRLGNQVERVKP